MATALMVIDAQRNMLEGDQPIPAAADVRRALEVLLARARSASALVVHVQNDGPAGSPDEPGTTGWEFAIQPAADELTVRKDRPDTFAANPHLIGAFQEHGIGQIIITGMQSDFCVQATGRAALAAGLHVILPRGAHATYDDELPAAEEATRVEHQLSDLGAQVVDLDHVTFTN
jgi:nicotinamidase-related amidase